MRQATIVCFGNSVTEGSPHVLPEDAFPAVLERRLTYLLRDGGRQIRVTNSGVGGENTAEGLARFDSAVVVHEPFLVTVEFGLNDLRPEPAKLIERDGFATNLREIHDRCRALGAHVVLMTPNPIINRYHASWGTDLYDHYGGCNGAVSAYAEVVREAAQQTGAVLCDIYGSFVEMAIEKQFAGECHDYSDLTCLSHLISELDGVHPTIAGQEAIAGELYKTLLLYRLLEGTG